MEVPLINTPGGESEPTGRNSGNFLRREHTIGRQDTKTLIEMGYPPQMVNKVYVFLRPRTLEEAALLLSEINGIYQHDFYYSSNAGSKCFICGADEKNHINYNERTSVTRDSKDSDLAIRISDGDKECIVCYSTCSKDELKRGYLPCGHVCCEICWSEYLKTKIEEATVAKITCVEVGCKEELSEDFILLHINGNSELIRKYNKFLDRARIIQDPSKKFCPEPDCDSYLEKGKDKYVTCKNGHQYCYVCLKKWHGSSKCDEQLDKDFQLWKKDKIVKQCPNCKIYTEKNEGCNHMTCAECKYQWCWLCQKKYSERHFVDGDCRGLQFTQINFLSEAPAVRNVPDYMRDIREREDECCCSDCCCMDCLFETFDYFHELDLVDGDIGSIIIFVILLFIFGAPVMAFEYWLGFLDSLIELSNCSRFWTLIISILMLITIEICYQILFLYILGLLIIPLIFYWPLWNIYIEFFIEHIYNEAEGIM